MTADSTFIVSETEGRHVITMQLTNGVLRLDLPSGTDEVRAEEITDYLNLVIDTVSFKKQENMQPDIERLNDEQPVSEAVQHL